MISVVNLLKNQFSVSTSDIDKAQLFQEKFGGRLEQLLINMGALSEESLPDIYAQLLSIDKVENETIDNWQPISKKPSHLQESFNEIGWFLLNESDDNFEVVALDPFSPEGNQLLVQYDLKFKLYVITPSQLDALTKKLVIPDEKFTFGEVLSDVEEERLRELADEAPTVNLLNSLITRALKMGASDMHLEPYSGKYRVRFRIDGVLQEVEQLAARMRLPIASRLKILSGMDIAEKRRPQDGKIAMKIANEELDIRVSSLPLNEGESIVMRFLRQDSINYDIDVLGLSADIRSFIEEDLTRTAGVILLTGPTGSGKTTSLYTFLNAINNDEVKIITLEDPVEYQLDGVNQVQINSDIDFNFSAGLRSIVRQDPDVIMLGEIRDKETAQVAMQSALTGHLVFSTVHTNDAPSAYTRLLDLGAEEYLLNAALISVIAQRLARKLCSNCAVPLEGAEQVVKQYQLKELADKNKVSINLRQATGCDCCNHTGFKGRMAVVEYLRCDEEIKSIAKDQYFPSKATSVNENRGGRNLLSDGLLKAIKGDTTIEEIIRVAG